MLGNPPIRAFLRDHSRAALSALIEGQAIVLSYADVTNVIALVALVSIPLVFLMRKPQAVAAPAAERPQKPGAPVIRGETPEKSGARSG